MDAQPLVSVVIPVYNGGRFVRDAILSVLHQTYPSIEIVVVDDGSTDDTPEVLATFGDAIRSFRQENAGVAAARNVGIGHSNGNLLAFLDADDVWLPDKLQRQVPVFTQNPDIGLAFTGYWVVDETLHPIYRAPVRDPLARLHRSFSLDDWGIGLAFTGMATREAVGEAGGYHQGLSTSADLEFAMNVASRHEVVGLSACLSLYRTHTGQMHVDIDRFEHDMTALYEGMRGVFATPSLERRAKANFHLRMAIARARGGDLTAALRHLWHVLRARPDRLFGAPLGAAARRVSYRALAVLASKQAVREVRASLGHS